MTEFTSRPVPARRLKSALLAVLPKGTAQWVRTKVFGRSSGSRTQWLREAMIADTERCFSAMGPERLDVVEVSGGLWQDWKWRSYRSLNYPDFDLCDPELNQHPNQYDLVICEQVLEHVPDPMLAVRTLKRLCKPGGHVYISTPFLVRLHSSPGDFWRYTPDGLKLLLHSQGLEPEWVRSWGNRRAIRANFDRWVGRRPWLGESLQNEQHLPMVVWALASPAQTPGA